VEAMSNQCTGWCCIDRLNRHDSPGTWLITPVESINESRQVSGTSGASKTQSELIRSYDDRNFKAFESDFRDALQLLEPLWARKRPRSSMAPEILRLAT
jgi:hypothetical protein